MKGIGHKRGYPNDVIEGNIQFSLFNQNRSFRNVQCVSEINFESIAEDLGESVVALDLFLLMFVDDYEPLPTTTYAILVQCTKICFEGAD